VGCRLGAQRQGLDQQQAQHEQQLHWQAKQAARDPEGREGHG
jgi:hypothetical protein